MYLYNVCVYIYQPFGDNVSYFMNVLQFLSKKKSEIR